MIKKSQRLIAILLLITLSLWANKKLILAEGNLWKPLLAPNLIKHYKMINKLPFSGFVMVGESFTKEVMHGEVELEYKKVWSELKGLKGLYRDKEIFLQINIDFPADFWDDKGWSCVYHNFEVVAKVAKELNFKGIVFDDEPYSKRAEKMSNFKFPARSEIRATSKRWEIKGSEKEWVDKRAYRNPSYNFKEHMAKVTLRFKEIMQKMLKVYPELTLLVYNGPSFAHVNSNRKDIIVTDVGLAREHEYKGAIFLGFKEGLEENATLYDMGESYRYRTNQHFKHAYEWRKFDIARASSNRVDSAYQWSIPKLEQPSWSSDVNIGFMVFNKGQKSNYQEFNTQKKATLKDIEKTLKKALYYSDGYVIYYCQDQDWLLPNQAHPLQKGWREMIDSLELSN